MLMFLNCDVPTEVSEEDFDFLCGMNFILHSSGKYLQCTSPKEYDKRYLHYIVAR